MILNSAGKKMKQGVKKKREMRGTYYSFLECEPLGSRIDEEYWSLQCSGRKTFYAEEWVTTKVVGQE